MLPFQADLPSERLGRGGRQPLLRGRVVRQRRCPCSAATWRPSRGALIAGGDPADPAGARRAVRRGRRARPRGRRTWPTRCAASCPWCRAAVRAACSSTWPASSSGPSAAPAQTTYDVWLAADDPPREERLRERARRPRHRGDRTRHRGGAPHRLRRRGPDARAAAGACSPASSPWCSPPRCSSSASPPRARPGPATWPACGVVGVPRRTVRRAAVREHLVVAVLGRRWWALSSGWSSAQVALPARSRCSRPRRPGCRWCSTRSGRRRGDHRRLPRAALRRVGRRRPAARGVGDHRPPPGGPMTAAGPDRRCAWRCRGCGSGASTALIVLVLATVASAASVVAPLYSRAAEESILRDTLRRADAFDLSVQVSVPQVGGRGRRGRRAAGLDRRGRGPRRARPTRRSARRRLAYVGTGKYHPTEGDYASGEVRRPGRRAARRLRAPADRDRPLPRGAGRGHHVAAQPGAPRRQGRRRGGGRAAQLGHPPGRRHRPGGGGRGRRGVRPGARRRRPTGPAGRTSTPFNPDCAIVRASRRSRRPRTRSSSGPGGAGAARITTYTIDVPLLAARVRLEDTAPLRRQIRALSLETPPAAGQHRLPAAGRAGPGRRGPRAGAHRGAAGRHPAGAAELVDALPRRRLGDRGALPRARAGQAARPDRAADPPLRAGRGVPAAAGRGAARHRRRAGSRCGRPPAGSSRRAPRWC